MLYKFVKHLYIICISFVYCRTGLGDGSGMQPGAPPPSGGTIVGTSRHQAAPFIPSRLLARFPPINSFWEDDRSWETSSPPPHGFSTSYAPPPINIIREDDHSWEILPGACGPGSASSHPPWVWARVLPCPFCLYSRRNTANICGPSPKNLLRAYKNAK